MNKREFILAINPGSTSTKISLFKEEQCILSENLSHGINEINKYETIYDQRQMRRNVILNWLNENKIKLEQILVVVGRGGLLRPMPGGTYMVTDKMLEDLKIGYQGQHASNLGGIIAEDIAVLAGVHAFIVDPVSVDEYLDQARISGMPDIPRRSLVHALNIKAVTRRTCLKLGKNFNNSSYVVAHIGGGISVSPVRKGRILDANNANEEGPFSPERAGGLPSLEVVEMAFSGKYTYNELKRKIHNLSGFMGYLGTNDGRVVDKLIENGNKKAELILKAMAYQLAKEIGAMSTVLWGKVDAIILTGGMAYNKRLTKWISDRVSFIAPVEIVPGEDEMFALAQGALRIIKGEEKYKVYEEEVQIND